MNTNTGTDTTNTSGLIVTNKCLIDKDTSAGLKLANGKIGNRNDLNEKENQNYSHENSFNEMTKGGGGALQGDDDVVLETGGESHDEDVAFVNAKNVNRHQPNRRLNGGSNTNNLHQDVESEEVLDADDDNLNHNDPNEFAHSENYDEDDDEDFFNEKNSHHSYHHNNNYNNSYNQNVIFCCWFSQTNSFPTKFCSRNIQSLKFFLRKLQYSLSN